MSSKSAPTNPPQYSISEILQNIEDYCVMGALGGTPFNSQEENDKLREDAVDNGRKAAEQAINQLIYTQVLEELQELRKDATTQEMLYGLNETSSAVVGQIDGHIMAIRDKAKYIGGSE